MSRTEGDDLTLIEQADAIAAHPMLPINKVGPYSDTRELVGALAAELRSLASEVERLSAEKAELERRLNEAQELYIEASNPGIDMDEVRRFRSAAALSPDGDK